MPPMNQEEMKRRLGLMHAAYLAKAPEKISHVEALWLTVRNGGPGDSTPEELVLAVHTLAGSAPTLGCEALGVAARELEIALRNVFAGEGTLSSVDKAKIDRLVERLPRSLA